MPEATLPESPRLFLVDGYALIYRAFFALISRPLRTSRGENSSAAWGIVNFLNRLLTTHKPEYLGVGARQRAELPPRAVPGVQGDAREAHRGAQDDFDRGMERICQLLEAYRVPIVTMRGYEADDVIGSLTRKGVDAGLNVVVVSGDKDFQQLVRPGVWLLNPGRGGPAAVDEQWVSVENGAERLGVPPERTVDYLALVGDSSDNVPGVKGIGDKGAQELIAEYGDLETILASVDRITKKRPREALQEHEAAARLSKELVTILCDLDVPLDLAKCAPQTPDHAALKQLFTELEFTSLLKDVVASAPAEEKPREAVKYETVDTVQALNRLVARARKARTIAVDTETVIDPGSPVKIDALRSSLVSVSVALAPGEAYYLPLAHRAWEPPQAELPLGTPDASGDRSPTDAPEDRGLFAGGDALGEPVLGDPVLDAPAKKKPAKKKAAAAAPEPTGIAGRMIAEPGPQPPRNLPPLDAPEMRPLVDLLEDPAVSKTLQNAKYDVLALRRAGVHLAGVEFDTMLASYVLDPGRRSHGMDVLAAEFLDHTMISYEDLTGRGKGQLRFDVVPVEAARDYSCEDADMTLRLRAMFEPQLESQGLTPLFRDVEVPLVCVLAEMEWAGIAIDVDHFRSLKTRFQAERERVEKEIYAEAGKEFNINSNPQLRTILFEELGLPVKKRTATGRAPTRACCRSSPTRGTRSRSSSWSTARSSSSRGRTSTRCRRSCTPTRGASTRRTARPSPRRGACRRTTRTCRTSRSGESWAGTSGAASSPARGGS
jgi:DNA polymerase-1